MTGVVLVDASFLDWFNRAPARCVVLEFILDAYKGRVAFDRQVTCHCAQHCIATLSKYAAVDHGMGDSEAVAWLNTLDDDLRRSIRRAWQDDAADLRLLAAACVLQAQKKLLVFLTNDGLLLRIADRLRLPHRCLKAALDNANEELGGGLRDSLEFGTRELEPPHDGNPNPFLHYGHDTRCAACHASIVECALYARAAGST